MSVGLYDADKINYPLIVYNLEIMKASAYYKKKGEIVSLSSQFTPNSYSKFILRKDYEDGIYPQQMYKYPNLEYGGHAFSGDNYSPMPEEIEQCHPDKAIYARWFRSFPFKLQEDKKAITTMSNAEHLRLSLDGKTLWDNRLKPLQASKTTRIYLFHDYDLNQIENVFDGIDEVLDSSGTKNTTFIGTKFPIQLNSLEEFENWNRYSYSCHSGFSINHILSDEDLISLVNQLKSHAASERIDYYVTNDSKTQEEFLEKDLVKILKQAIFLRSHKVNFLLKIGNDFFTDPYWRFFIEVLSNLVSSSLTVPSIDPYRETMGSWMKGYSNYLELGLKSRKLEKIRDLYQYIANINYDFFYLMYTYNGYAWEDEHR